MLGGVAAGKSTAARFLAEAGAVHLDADALAKARLEEPDAKAALAARFGKRVFDPAGSVDRAALAREVFASPSARKELEDLVHPAVRARLLTALDRAESDAAAAGATTWIALDVPLLAESGWIHLCDHLLFVEAPAAAREARAQRDRGWDLGEVARRDAAQVPLEVKRRLAEAIFTNEDVAALRARILAWIGEIRRRTG